MFGCNRQKFPDLYLSLTLPRIAGGMRGLLHARRRQLEHEPLVTAQLGRLFGDAMDACVRQREALPLLARTRESARTRPKVQRVRAEVELTSTLTQGA